MTKNDNREQIIPYTLLRSRRRSIGIEVRPDGEVVVRAPLRVPEREILRVVRQKQNWIGKHREIALRRLAEADAAESIGREELQALAEEASRVIPERVAHYAPLVGVDCGRITIRSQRTRWGSCSAKGNLNFNCLLMLTPPEVIDSVVVHELCHRLEMNHSARFYQNVLRVYPDYRKWERWLREHGPAILSRVR